MKLTNSMRDAFIRAVMNDVPRLDHREEIRKLALADAVAALPAAVRKLWVDADLRQYVKTHVHYYHGVGVTIPHPEEGCSWRGRDSRNRKLSPETEAKVDALHAEMKAADETHDALERKLRTAAYGCTTRKQLAALLPEFEKYLPDDEAKAVKENLPAIANLVADFTKAGWPKGKQNVSAAASDAATSA